MRHPTGLHSSAEIEWKQIRLLVFGLDDQFRFLARQTFRKLNVREVVSFSIPGDVPGLMERGADMVLVDLGGSDECLGVVERLRRPEGNPFGAVPILVVAGPTEKARAERARALGIEGIIPKPISGHELTLRVTEALVNPQRLSIPVVAAAKPKISYIKDPDPLPDLAEVETPAALRPSGADAPIPEVAALAARIAARSAAAGERPDRQGPWSALTGIGGAADAVIQAPPQPVLKPQPGSKPQTVLKPQTVPQPAPSASPAAPAAPAPSPRPTALSSAPAARGAPTRRLSEGSLYDGDLPAVKRPSGGRLSDEDVLSAAPKETTRGFEVASPRPDPDEAARRAAAERRKRAWQEEMEKVGHTPRKGSDVAALDVSAVVAEHGKWLQSKGAEGKRATFTGMDLAGADLSGTILANATFREVDLSDACLSEARLDGADFRYATLSAADLRGANLGVAALRHAKLDLTNLEGASFRGCDLSGATFTGARMAGADFKGATLIGADLREADLSKVEGVSQGQLEKTICDMSTRLPPGVFRPRSAET